MATAVPTRSDEPTDDARAVGARSYGVASFPPPIAENPYQRLLYEALAGQGFELAAGNRLKLDWLLRSRGRVSLLHFHWPQGYYHHDRGPLRLRGGLSWVRLGLFAGRLAAARALGFRIAWTVHQLYPHEPRSLRLERIAVRTLARASDVLIAHDATTAASARAGLGRHGERIRIVPHGSYVGVYRSGRPRDQVRRELGIDKEAVVFLCFGHVRGYKSVELLLTAFAAADLRNAVLVVAGLPVGEDAAAAVSSAAERDPRVRALLEFVPEERVAELHSACDVAVLPRSDGGTSGALVLALSLGLPVIAADLPAYRTLTHAGALGWHFEAGSRDSLCSTLEQAAREPAAKRAEAAAFALATTGWDEVAASTAALFREALA